MSKEKFSVKNLAVGMMLLSDVCTESGQLVANEGTVLNQRSIDKLNYYQIDWVYIYVPNRVDEIISNSTVSSTPKPRTHLQRIRESQDFYEFNKIYFEHMRNFETLLKNIISSDSTIIDVDALLSAPSALLDNINHNLGIFDLLHNIHNLDDSTYAHSLNVSIIANIVGKWLHLSDEDLKVLTSGGLLHDIGKLLIPEEILLKPAKLSKDEFEQIQQHANYGYSILKDKEIDTRIKSCALFHHEKVDGSGYPFGKKGESLPFFSQIITIVDTYEAMTAKRVYREGLCPFAVIKLYEKEGFSKYNVQILMTFLENLVQTYIGYTARLTDGRIGKIVFINKMDLSHPIVKSGNTFIDLTKEKKLEIETLL